MPNDKKKNMRQPSKPQKAGGLGSANNYFETAEELANRPEHGSQGKMQKRNQATQNPEKPQQ